MRYFIFLGMLVMVGTIAHIQILEAKVFPETSFALMCIDFVKILFEKWFLF